MALSADEQDLFDHARAALPRWFWSDERANEELGGSAKVMGSALTQVKHWLGSQALIQTAAAATGSEPDWLDAHARDRGTTRFSGESLAATRYRLRTPANTVTRPLLVTSITEMMAALAMAGTAAVLELPRDQAFFGSNTGSAGTGGTFTAPVANVMTFSPTVPLTWPPYTALAYGKTRTHQLVISGAGSAGNNGTFTVTGVVGNALRYTNASGVAAAPDAGAAWEIRRLDHDGVNREGRARAYLSRGYRMGRGRGGSLIVILPHPATEAQRRSVEEMLRQRKAAGVVLVVERRANP